ncbi:glycosyltransferase [Planococcus sp. CP5-4]|uniref:glycosyltransferase n=1 Tax=unclassified Planococcus (in: firmicutes) TaxID=2662419 RepID=UPI001C22A22D|nr:MULTISPECIES: glycosyltransferase [unclassified Planococcus (in: firmicutes)]MBU9674512.1 glycosyltransferase [Planococcus sp. CP5-4_YE]MBV0910143.1 glycosyltransferase [Planococcus sp. CP5-4_UN]MBW6064650.1 glycosyltransferase [Planococcus sp. CP5-4]
MTQVILLIMLFFWVLLIFYSILTISGVWYRMRFIKPPKLSSYPSVAVLIPAHNEGIVMEDTLRAMARLQYSGQLDIYVLDDNSKDDTAEIAQEFAEVFSRIHYIPVPVSSPSGKSRVLNYGLSISQSDYFVVYDADNEPEPDAVELLVEVAERTKKAAGAVGYVKTKNAHTNTLTRMIGLEFQVFQLLMQCGRWQFLKLGSLAGTNMLLRRSVLDELGGYDVNALAEDAELTVRLHTKGYLLPVVPESKTWEQEPEKLTTFIKQRTRWLTGNIYLLEKSFKDLSHWRGKTFFLSLQHVLTYLVFVVVLLFSDIFFIMSILGMELPNMEAPLLMLWFMSYIVYTAQLLSALVVDRNVSPKNVFFIFIMYFTYAQLFIILLLRSVTVYIWSRVRGNTIAWDKTKRFKGVG